MKDIIAKIVESAPEAVREFFRRFETARDNLTLPRVAEALNRAQVEEKWYEIFRDIYVIGNQLPRRDTDGVRKDPEAFALFARTNEILFMKSALRFGEAADLRMAFERYLFSRDGAGAWGAMDWELDRYLQTRVYAELERDEYAVLKRIAALALTMREVAAGELRLYIDEREDVKLPLARVSNTIGETPLLDYYHYDRYTSLPYARSGERVEELAFDPHWLAQGVISDVILKEARARSTESSVRTVALRTLAEAMLRIKGKLGGGSSHQAVLIAAETLYAFATDKPGEFAALKEEELVEALGIEESPSEAKYEELKDAESFWRTAMPHFNRLKEAFDKEYAEAGEPTAAKAESVDESVIKFVRHALETDRVSELFEIGRNSLRTALKSLIKEKVFRVHPKTLAYALLGRSDPRPFRIEVGAKRKKRELPAGLLFDENESEELRRWAVEVLEKISGGKISYANVDFAAVKDAADRLWNFYFTENEICRGRWMVSIDRVLEILAEAEAKHYAKYPIGANLNWPCAAKTRRALKERLELEKETLIEAGFWPDDMEELKRKLLSSPSVTIDSLLSGESRILVMIAVLARLYVRTKKKYSELWKNREDLTAFFTHILIASNHDFEMPFPWHLDVTSSSYLRIGRTHNRQTNVVDELISGKFHDESEWLIYKAFIAYERD